MTRSLRARLLVWTVGGMALLMAVFGVVVYEAVHRSLVGGFDASLASAARAVAGGAEVKHAKIDLDVEEAAGPEFRRADRPEYFELWDAASGTVVARSPSLGKGDLPRIDATAGDSVFQPVRLPDGRPGRAAAITFLPKTDEGENETEGEDRAAAPAGPPKKATLVLARETAPLDAEIAMLRWLLAVATGGTVLLALVVAAVVVRQGLKPLGSLASQIAAVREDSLGPAIATDRMPDELAPVVARLNDLLARLGGAFRRERAFTADAAHELRTPLAGIRSTLEVALSRPRRPAEYQAEMGECLDIVRHMQDMVGNLLALARLEGGQATLHPERLPLAEAVETAWRPLAERAHARGLSFESSVPADLACTADRGSIEMILANLLENAVEYADEGGHVRVAARPSGERVELAVSNTGCRLSEEEVRYVFERFWRGDASRTDSGRHFGLGLALVERTAVALGGSVTAESVAGAFSIRIILPAG